MLSDLRQVGAVPGGLQLHETLARDEQKGLLAVGRGAARRTQSRGRAPQAGQAIQHLTPTCSATMPPARLCTSTCAKPEFCIMALSVAWSGCMRMLSAR